MSKSKKSEHYGSRTLFSLANAGQTDELNDDHKKVGAWFLGPKGENESLMEDLVKKSIKEHANFRSTHYKKGDPAYIDDSIKNSPAYQAAKNRIYDVQKDLMQRLHGSVPFFSQRYQAHMNWDTALPANVGYMTAMLYNQNNVATEGGPATSLLEKEVGQQLCQLLGFDKTKSWGHITADGTIANIESMWANRNLKFYPLAFKETILAHPKELALAFTDLKVTVYEPEGLNGPEVVMVLKRKPLIKCDTWQLLNLECDEVLNLPTEINKLCGLQPGVIDTMLSPFLVQNAGLISYANRYPEIKNIKVFVPATKHYSWPKAGTLLGLGQNSIVNISVDDKCRMDVADLERQLLDCAKNKIPVMMVTAVFGSTEEGIIDDLESILALRKKARTQDVQFNGINFNIHCDAAWGGYLRSMMIPSAKEMMEGQQDDGSFVDSLPLSVYAQKQYSLMAKADTITIDPHKSGFIPYPAGSLCYRNSLMRYLITFNAAYIHSNDEIAMGIYGLEGSKPGAAPAAIWTAHQVIPLDRSGYGQILGECTFSTKIYYCYWLTLANESDDFRIETLIPLPQQIYGKDGKTIIAAGKPQILDYIRTYIIGKSNEEIAANGDAIALLQQIGSDVLINSFVVNFRKNGKWNTDIKLINDLNTALFNKFSITSPEQVLKDNVDYIITSSQLDSECYKVPLKRLCNDLGIATPASFTMNFIINTILQPWPTTHGFIGEIMTTFKKGIVDCISKISVADELVKLTGSVSDDLVTRIPADATQKPQHWYTLDTPSYAGYASADKNGNKLFYWFFQSKKKATAQTPLILWLNGGPGASSLAGLFLENGPFTMQDDVTVVPNSMSWNEEAHMIFWDQPVGTGFSTMAPQNYVDTEAILANQFVNALQFFYTKHPEYRGCPLFLTGESYAGKYLPYIGLEINNRNLSGKEMRINLKGIAIGNGWMYPEIQTRDQIDYAYMLGLVDTNQRDKAEAQYLKFVSDLRQSKMADAFTDGNAVSDMLVACGGGENIYDVRSWSDAPLQPLQTYLSSSVVKECIHVPQDVNWAFSDAAGPVTDHLMNDLMASVISTFPKLVEAKGTDGKSAYKMLFYTGNFDMSCGFTGTETILRDMDWHAKNSWAKLKRRVWFKQLDPKTKQALGCVKSFENLTQIEIPMSGHQVPMYKPEISKNMIYNWIFDRKFDTYDPLQKTSESTVKHSAKELIHYKY